MHKGAIKAIVLSAVFLIAVVIFSYMTNQTNEDLTTEMAEATLPVITLYNGEMEINELHGYSTEMNAAYMRDTITPVQTGEKLPVMIQTYQTPVDGISYEIRSLDAKRLIANADANAYTETKGIISVDLEIQNLLTAGEEYLLVIELESGDKTIYYYTRIVEPQSCYVEECLAFVKDFNEKTFNEETVGTLSTYLEKTTGNNSTLQFTSLNNSLKQIGWADLDVKCLSEPVPSIKEITPTYNVIVLDYVVTHVSDNGETEYYNVEEYYRVRYTSQRMYLLNFERTVNEIFRGENDSFSEKNIQLGIRSSDVEYKSNESGKVVAFVQEGELWSYNQTENSLAKVFSFRGYEGIDERENYREHDIRIVGVDEAGSIDYIVYGYMNRGIHEGEVGIAIYHYDSLANTNEEFVFIPSTKSYEIMKSELGQLMYVSDGGMFYIMVDGNVYGINLGTLEKKVLIENLTDEAFAVSASDRFIAWVEAGKVNAGTSIQVMDFTTEKVWEIEAKSGEYVRPLGFMEEDFVYGIAKAGDVTVDAAGNTAFPMYQVKILDTVSEEHEILKTYEKAGYYVSDIYIEDYTMYLNRIQFNGTAYADADQDMIMNREGDGMKLVDITESSSKEKETEVQIVLAEAVAAKAPKILTPKETLLEDKPIVSLKDEDSEKRYYVYVKGDVILTTDDVAEAVIAANEKMGIVIGDNQQYVWKRSRKTTQNAFTDVKVGEEDDGMSSIAQCINAMLENEGINISVNALLTEGETPKEILRNAMKEASVLDLTGCTVDEILYYVSNGSPVFAMTGSDDAVLIIGYDASSLIIFDPEIGVNYREKLETADELFGRAGSIFFTYLKDESDK